MAAFFLMRSLPLRIRPRLASVLLFGQLRRPAFTTAAEESVCSSPAKETEKELKLKDNPKPQIFDDSNSCDWEATEREILQDIEPITLLTKQILHSIRYMDGDRLSAEDEKVLVENLLPYHPNSEDKIGCGVDSIMVDRHPVFGRSRCLFVVSTDGKCTDFSYKKCLRQYIRDKYPSHAERFIQQHLRP